MAEKKKGPACRVCTHPAVRQIEMDIAANKSMYAIAARFGIHRLSVLRHRDNHMDPAALVAANEERFISVLDRAEALSGRVEAALEAHEGRGGSPNGFAVLVRELRACLELIGRLRHELDEGGPRINLIVHPAWIQIRSAVLDALAAFPEARVAVAERLELVENNAQPGR